MMTIINQECNREDALIVNIYTLRYQPIQMIRSTLNKNNIFGVNSIVTNGNRNKIGTTQRPILLYFEAIIT